MVQMQIAMTHSVTTAACASQGMEEMEHVKVMVSRVPDSVGEWVTLIHEVLYKGICLQK